MTETISSAPGRAARGSDRWTAPILLAVAAAGWWWSVVSARSMDSGLTVDAGDTLSFFGFVVAWVAMMAMMLPAVLPVVRLYRRAAAAGAVVPDERRTIRFSPSTERSVAPPTNGWR